VTGPPLSRREREVAGLIADGLTDRAIAQRLFISGRTAEGYVRQILDKLGFDNRAQIASWATSTRLGAADSAPEQKPAATPNNLPMQVTTFIGRERELAETRRLLQRVRVLTISGPAGSGKTRLAIQAATEVLHRYPDGAWFVDLSAVTDPNVVPRSIAAALRIREGDGVGVLEAVASALVGGRHRRDSLLVLDNCEHLVDHCATTVATLIRASPHLTFLCTSREPLHIPGEAVWRLHPLPLPAPTASFAEVVRQSDAVRLFLDRVSLSDPSFDFDEANAAEVLHLCRRLDGLPLALELAAARVGLMPFDQLLRHLERRFSGPRMRGMLSRQETLTATLDWSYALLNEAEQALLRRLGVFGGGFTLEAVEAVCADPNRPEPDVLDLLAQLVDKSLVLPVPPRTRRYRCLGIIRRYALDRLAESGQLDPVRRRHLDHFLTLAESAARALTGPEQSSWLERLADDHDNLRAALEASRSVDIERRLRLVLALDRFWTVRGHLGEGRQWMEEVLAAAEGTAATPLRAMVSNAAGGLAFQQGDLAGARAHLEASLALWGKLGERLRIQPCLNNLGLIAAAQHDWEAARAWDGESLGLARELGDDRATSLGLGNLGVALASMGEHEAAQAHLDEALDLARTLGDSMRIAMALANLGTLAVRRERADEAARRYRESLEILRSLGARSNVAECIEGFAWLAARTGQLERAMRLAGAAAAIRSAVGTPRPASSSPLIEDWITEARAALGDAAAAWEAGWRLSDEEAIRLALDEQGRQRPETA
jgi:predicted ATPase/DNA-binding CsgD family transcriptional regulator